MRNIGLAVKNTPKPKREHLQMTLYNWGSLAFILKAKLSSFGWFVGTVGGLKQMSGNWVMDILPQFKLYNYLLSFLSVLINVLRTLS